MHPATMGKHVDNGDDGDQREEWGMADARATEDEPDDGEEPHHARAHPLTPNPSPPRGEGRQGPSPSPQRGEGRKGADEDEEVESGFAEDGDADGTGGVEGSVLHDDFGQVGFHDERPHLHVIVAIGVDEEDSGRQHAEAKEPADDFPGVDGGLPAGKPIDAPAEEDDAHGSPAAEDATVDISPETEDRDDPKEMDAAKPSCFDIGTEGSEEAHASHGGEVGTGVEVVTAFEEGE